jgi:quercetin dioxygenase-like cupin family protein
MEITKAGTRTTLPSHPDWVLGDTWLEKLIESPEPSRARLYRVTFAPGARTSWHTHPLGQAVVVLEGVALIGDEEGRVHRCVAGDVVWIQPGERHWHGADAGVAVQLNLQEADSAGAIYEFYEPVADEIVAAEITPIQEWS